MKLKNLTFPIVFTLAIVALFVQCKEATTNQTAAPIATADSAALATLPIAYINVDTLLQNYNYSKDLTEALLRKQENARASINEKGRKLEQEAAAFQRKIENNAFLSRERAEQEQQRLVKQQEELNQLMQRLEAEIMSEQQKMMMQMEDSIHAIIAEYNAKAGFQAILNQASTLYIDKKYDITNDLLDILNKRYEPKK